MFEEYISGVYDDKWLGDSCVRLFVKWLACPCVTVSLRLYLTMFASVCDTVRLCDNV